MARDQDALEYHTVDLFGGAIQASLPTSFGDVSDIRQVPDNQEVYLSTTGFTSITFDILERVSSSSDTEALDVHLEELVEDDASTTKIYSRTLSVQFPKLPAGTPALALLATTPPPQNQRGRDKEPEFVAILLTLVRLETKGTDLVIAVNVPHIPGEEGGYVSGDVDFEAGRKGRLLREAEEIQGRAMETFEVREWGLFV